ncbi:MAG: hypothetical protein ACK5P5_10385, partial [Pseudobdellovibrionaceae bacterium]
MYFRENLLANWNSSINYSAMWRYVFLFLILVANVSYTALSGSSSTVKTMEITHAHEHHHDENHHDVNSHDENSDASHDNEHRHEILVSSQTPFIATSAFINWSVTIETNLN